ncbi:MAG: aspartate-semialdehyde dehydrogenase [Christensenellales bacterium]|nr:aspartate-semialdehyde dehydrogenase [Christensenellales bacterium]
MKPLNIAILGATGAVGREMLNILDERNFPVRQLRLLASARSAGKVLTFRGEKIVVEEATEQSFEGMDIVLGAASAGLARQLAPAIVNAGAVFVDNSSAFRMQDDVPLIVPEINPEDVRRHHGIISNPNCSTIITLTAISALHRLSPIRTMVASTYQAVSGAGADGLTELENQTRAYAEGQPLNAQVFPYQIAFNLIPQIGSDTGNGYTSEEMKMQNEGRKILHLPDLTVSCTCIRVPVLRSHSISVTLVTERKITVEEARAAIAQADGCRLVDNLEAREYPMPLDTSNQDIVFVGRIREDLTNEKGLTLWCCGDQIRKGAATNAVQIAELLIR